MRKNPQIERCAESQEGLQLDILNCNVTINVNKKVRKKRSLGNIFFWPPFNTCPTSGAKKKLKNGHNQSYPIKLTYSSLEPDVDYRALVALVLSGVVSELGDPALGGAIRGPSVHEPVHHQ